MSHLELQEFFVEGDSQKKSHVLLHITEPSTPKELERGYFFALAEINNGTFEHIEHLQNMIDDLESGFYATEQATGIEAFESTLEYINRRGHTILQGKNLQVNCLIGIIKDNTLAFSHHGDMHALLFYRGAKDTQTMDILKDAKNDAGSGQLFSSILQGKLNTGDFFFIGSPYVEEFFSYDRLQKIITSRSVKQSTAHIEKVLSDVHAEYSFGGIVFRVLAKQQTQLKKTAGKDASAASLNKLIDSRKKTAETLSPPLLKHLTQKIKGSRNKKTERIRSKKSAPQHKPERQQKGKVETNYRYRDDNMPGQSFLNTLLIGLGRAIVAGGVGAYNLIKKIFMTLAKGLVGLFIIITNKNNSRNDVIQTMRKTWKKKKGQFEDLPMMSKMLFVATIIAGIIFILSIGVLKLKENYQAKTQADKNLVQAVIDKKDAAEASLIYNDQEKAFTLLNEAKELVQTLPTNKKAKREQKETLEKQIEDLMIAIRKLEMISPQVLVNITEQYPNAKTTYIAQIDNTLVAYGPNDNKTYSVDATSGALQAADHVGAIKLGNATTPKEQDTIVFLNKENSVATYNKSTKTVSAKDISFPLENASIVDGFVYNVRLYTVDTTNNQIYKHNKTQTGYDRGTTWLKQDADLSDATSLAIDGDIFVLKKNGEIYKFAKGNQESFSVAGLDPKLDSPTELFAYNDIDYLYILEPTHKRVVVLDKEGKLVKQYSSDAWKNPTGLVVKEAGNTIYVLDDNKIYSFSL